MAQEHKWQRKMCSFKLPFEYVASEWQAVTKDRRHRITLSSPRLPTSDNIFDRYMPKNNDRDEEIK